MPRPHREGIAKQSPATAIKLGQVWENRWTHRQTQVTAGPNEFGVVSVQAHRRAYISEAVLRRDYILVSG